MYAIVGSGRPARELPTATELDTLPAVCSPEVIRRRAERATLTARYCDEPAYVPYFWWARTRRLSMRIGDIWLLTVTAADVALFPDLADVPMVAVRETDGHVHETSAEDALRDCLRGR